VKVYLSSTLEDLREHRETVATSLRSMGHDVLGMEQYTAEDIRPLDRCLEDVQSSDVYVVIAAWRYGYIPTDSVNRKRKRSITELEYEEALEHSVAVLAFLLDPVSPWPPSTMDAFGEHGAKDIAAFRRRLGEEKLAGIFTTPDNLARQVTASMATKGLSRKITHRALDQVKVAARMAPFAKGEPTALDTDIPKIIAMITEARDEPALPLELRPPGWWSTRLYLMAALTERLTDVRQLVFTQGGRFVGMASPASVRQALCAEFPELAKFQAKMEQAAVRAPPPPVPPTDDVERGTHRWADEWRAKMWPREGSLKVDVRRSLLERWLGERLVTRCVEVGTELTMVDVQQIVDSPLPDVPLERPQVPARESTEPPDPSAREIVIVSRDAFAVQLARQWVRAEIPRIPQA
jgi:Domain of unknown function (DUF4062)